MLCPVDARPGIRKWSTRWGIATSVEDRSEMEAQAPVEQRAVKQRPSNYHSRLTSKPQRPVVSQCTALGKRLRDLADAFAERLGGWSALSVTTAAAVRRAAELVTAAEMARADMLNGQPTDMLALVRLEGVATRAVRALGLKVELPKSSRVSELRQRRWEEQAAERARAAQAAVSVRGTTIDDMEPPHDDRSIESNE
jgi:hypothetical protein